MRDSGCGYSRSRQAFGFSRCHGFRFLVLPSQGVSLFFSSFELITAPPYLLCCSKNLNENGEHSYWDSNDQGLCQVAAFPLGARAVRIEGGLRSYSAWIDSETYSARSASLIKLQGIGTTHRKAWAVQCVAIVGQSCSLLCLKMITTIAPSSFFGHNVDLPIDIPSRKKKPFLRPLKLSGKKSEEDEEESMSNPPGNGMQVPELIPVAHDTLKARSILMNGVRTLLKAFPVKACRYCPEVHVGPVGHQIASCQGKYNGPRHGRHDWVDGDIDDVFPSMDVFHLSDSLGKVITHEDRLSVEKLPAVVELCIQAGVDVAGYSTKRRSKPVVRIHKKLMDFDNVDFDEGPHRWIPRPARAKKVRRVY